MGINKVTKKEILLGEILIASLAFIPTMFASLLPLYGGLKIIAYVSVWIISFISINIAFANAGE